jgi:hypothetical protein
MIFRIAIIFTSFLALASIAAALPVRFQSRDHLTSQEVDLVKEAQALDKRIEVFIKAIDRRLLVIDGVTTPNTKELKKDAELWGDLPSGSRGELVNDIARIFDEAITNIDDVSSRDERNPLIPKALRRLAQSVNAVMAHLGPLRDQVKSEAEIASFELLNEDSKSILEAASKLPPDVDKKGKRKNDKAKESN